MRQAGGQIWFGGTDRGGQIGAWANVNPCARARLGEPSHQRRGGRGFTLIEVAVVVIIIALLASLALVALSHAMATGREAAERAAVNAMKLACEQFHSDFGFDVPLVDDSVDPAGNGDKVAVRDNTFLAYGTADSLGKPHYSELSLAYYLTGVLPAEIDGKDGPGMTEVSRDGTFSKSGRVYGPYTDVERDRRRLTNEPNNVHRFLDRWGNPLRYYAWRGKPDNRGTPDNDMEFYAPRLLGDPLQNMALRSARYAIVSLGPDGLTDEGLKPFPGLGGEVGGVTQAGERDPSADDDIVEVGP